MSKDLTYYLSHTDEMPTDPKELERLANEHMNAALESGAEAMDVDKLVGKADEPPGADAAKVEEPKKEAEPEKPEEKQAEVKPDGILAKDGKNVIPYSQLENARQRAAKAEALAGVQAAELAQLRAAKAAPEGAESTALTEEELAALEAESPTLAKTLRSQQAAIQSLKDALINVAQAQQERAVSEIQEVKSEIQAAIDANPALAEWQTAEDQTMWERASAFDKVIREMPEYANVAFADRFEKVVEMTRSALGLEAPKAETRELNEAQVKEAAKAVLAKAASKRPVSLSDIPGGAPPALDERQKVEEMSSVALGNQFLAMNKEQMEAYLASL